MTSSDSGPDPSGALKAQALAALQNVIDPELGLNVVDLGLVYGIEVSGDAVHVLLTMTTPACPLGEQILLDARQCLTGLRGIGAVTLELVWEPEWTPERMSDTAKRALGWGE